MLCCCSAEPCAALLLVLVAIALPVALSETPHTVLPIAQGLVCFLPGCAVVPVGDFDRDGADDLAFVSADPTPLPDATAPTAATTLWRKVIVLVSVKISQADNITAP
eukprot:m51a1_g13124 hypothetical protein (107) ;mRNA; r:581-2674